MSGMAAQFLSVNSFVSPKSPFSSSFSPRPPSARFTKPSSHGADFPPASRVFVRNLSYSTDESRLKSLFSDFGQIAEVKLARDEETKKSKGYAFVQYSCQDDAILAMEHMDRKIIDGRAVFVEIAKPVSNRSAGRPISSGPPPRHRS